MAERTVTEKCFRTTDVWLDISKDFAILQGIIRSEKEDKYPVIMENIFGDIGLTASYGYSKGIVSEEEMKIMEYHRDRIRNALDHKLDAIKKAEEAIMWAGRTFADKVVTCECGTD